MPGEECLLGDENMLNGTPFMNTIDDKLRLLIEEGKRDGGITYERFNEIFPEDCNSPERIDEIFATLDAHDIELREDSASAPEEDGDGDTQAEALQEKIDDPVRMYLTQMGRSRSLRGPRSSCSPRRSRFRASVISERSSEAVSPKAAP